MAGSRKGKKGSNKKSSNKKKKQAKQAQAKREENQQQPPQSSDDEDFKDDEPERDLDIVDASRLALMTPRGSPVHDGFDEQVEHDKQLFQEQKYTNRTEFKLPDVSGSDTGNEAFCVAFNAEATLLAAGCGDGVVRVYNAGGKLAAELVTPSKELPVTCVRWRPTTPLSDTKNILIAADANGSLSHWHAMSKTCLFSLEEEDNQIYAVEYTADGATFATAGRDTNIRLYDEATKTNFVTLSSGKTIGSAGHSNRIYSVKYLPGSTNTIVSGGWDNTVLVWDIRSGTCVRSMYGPHICGDALDIDPTGKQILTGSWRPEDSLEIWDLGTAKLQHSLSWQKKVKGKSRPEMLYAVKWAPNGSYLLAGGAGTADARVFDAKTYQPVDRIPITPKGVYCVDISADSRHMAVAGAGTKGVIVDV